MKVCLAPTRVLACPELGGHAWAYLQWTLGLLENGCEVIWLERLPLGATAERALACLRQLHLNLESVGVRVPVALVLDEEEAERLEPVAAELAEVSLPLDEAIEGADLLLDFHYSTESELVRRFPRSALVDIDPGLLQMWMHEGQLDVAEHDCYYTIGETVGTSAACFPDGGRQWIHTPPAVCLDAWKPQETALDAPFTAVSSWHQEWQLFGGEAFPDDKRAGLQPFLDLPGLVSVPLELALWVGDEPAAYDDWRELKSRGWRVRSARLASPTPRGYQRYVASSAGEFGWAKPSYVRLQTAWISDRSLCYLASGKPAIVQHTGPSGYLPEDEGMLRYRSLSEAVNAFERVCTDYEFHARRARELAEQHFDARQVTARVLEHVLVAS